MTQRKYEFETRAAHAGLRQRVGDTHATVAPIVASTTFGGESIDDVHRALGPDPVGFAYARNANPTVAELEASVALLEGAEGCVAFGSGMGAIHAALIAVGLGPGDTIVAASDLYGVTRGLFTQLEEYDILTEYVDISNVEAVEEHVGRPDARLLYFESISNPLLRVADVATLVEIGHRHHATVVIDNTFATPYLLRPLECGADLVIHSATKYMAGHGDVIAGLVAGNVTWTKRLKGARTISGSVLSPFEAWLTMRGLRTLPVRMDRHCKNAETVADWLHRQEWVEHVYYPGLPDNDQFALASLQFGGRFGGMLAFDLRAGRDETLRFIDSLELITAGTSLGDVESLVLYPPLSSHRTLDAAGLEAAGIRPGLIRLSVGLEDVRDLIADLEGAAESTGLLSQQVARLGV